MQIETVKGKLGEFTVSIDGYETITADNRYPNPIKIARQVRALLAQ
ncbi:MAG: hypothetical protein AB1489_17680 [Acidobacteriota bacterium]